MIYSLESDAAPFGIKRLSATNMGWATVMHQYPRGLLPSNNTPAIYVLLNDNRKVCYIGETGRGAKGGIRARLTAHQSRIPWWTHCVYFTDPAFDNENLRLWLESHLRLAVLPDVIVTSHAGKAPLCLNGPVFLEHILQMSAAFCLSLFVSRPMQTWSSRKALSEAIAEKFNPTKKCAGHINHVLTPRVDKRTGRVTMPGKYRPLLERLGVKFASDGRVSSWAFVPCPLPDLQSPYFS